MARRSVPAETSPIHVFVSYAHEDEQAVAGLVADLRREGVDVWFAQHKLQPADRISGEVRAAIEKARFVLVALTQQARNSAQHRLAADGGRNS
ncbi:toll/interleukin-1 receptor domain-containing protein [Luteitalea pratensis]|uniref:toll/interleukin-1 receptor domain-containing protein n=1 Tax=Luteitalea pratensis TaxID=1855912 RepID=UPI000D737B0C